MATEPVEATIIVSIVVSELKSWLTFQTRVP